MLKVSIRRSNFRDKNFKKLVAQLDADLAIRDGSDHEFYHQFNGIEKLDRTLIAYVGKAAVGIGALKQISQEIAEVKRMFVLQEYRGQRIATKLLEDLEMWAIELGYGKLILETGIRNPEAIALYKRCKYLITDNYDQYIGLDSSICFAKDIQ